MCVCIQIYVRLGMATSENCFACSTTTKFASFALISASIFSFRRASFSLFTASKSSINRDTSGSVAACKRGKGG